MTKRIPAALLTTGLVLLLGAPALAAEKKVPSSRHGDTVGALQMDQMPRPDRVGRAPGTPSQPKLVRERVGRSPGTVTPTPTGAAPKGSDRPLVRNGYVGKADPVKPKPKLPGKPSGGGKPGKVTPNPNGTGAPSTAGAPARPGGDIDPRARRAHAAMSDSTEEEEIQVDRPRPNVRPVRR